MDCFAQPITTNGWPEKLVNDMRWANLAGLQMDIPLLLHGWFWLIEICQVKNLNNVIEQYHRRIKQPSRPN